MQFVNIRSIMKTIATISEAVAALLLLYLCGCGSANDCELGGKDAVICAQCSSTTAGVRWTALHQYVSTIRLQYNCYSSEGTNLQLHQNDTCFKGREIPDPPTFRHGSETVSLFHVVDSTLSAGTLCTFSGYYKDSRTQTWTLMENTNCTVKNTTECLEYPSSCQLPATCVNEGDNCNCHCNEGFAGHSGTRIFAGANCSSIDNTVPTQSSASTGSLPTSTVSVLPVPTDQLLPSMATLIQPSLTAAAFPEATQGTDQLLPTENPLRESSILGMYSMTTFIQHELSATPFLETTNTTVQEGRDLPAALPVAVAGICAALLILTTLTVILIVVHRSRCQTNRFYGLKFTDELDPDFQPVKINETPFSFGSLHSIFHTLHPQTGHDNVSISKSEGIIDPTDCDKISQLQTSGDVLKVKPGTDADLNVQNAVKASLISQQREVSPMGSTGSIELVCSTEIAPSDSTTSLRMSNYMEESATQPLATPTQHPSGGYIQDSNMDQVTSALPMPGIIRNSPALQQENTSGENPPRMNLGMNCTSGEYVQDATNVGGNGAYIRDAMGIGLEACGNMELESVGLQGETETSDDISLSILDNIETDHFNIHSSTKPIQNSTQGYLQESDAATFPAQPCIGNHSTQIYMDSECKRDNPLQTSSNNGGQNGHQPAEDVCTQRFTSGYTLQGDHFIFKGDPGGLRYSESEPAVCEVPLSTLEFTKSGTDGYVQQNDDTILELPSSLSTGTSHDPHCIGFHTEYDTPTNSDSVAPPLASTMQQPSLDYVRDSNTERISTNSPTLQQSQKNTLGENRSKMNNQMNCMSGDYVCDATEYASNGGNGAYIRDPMNIDLDARGDMEIGCLDLEGEAEGEIPLNMLDMTEMHSNTLPMQSSSQQPSLDYVQNSNTERVSTNSPALQQSHENTSGEGRSKTIHQVNSTSGYYVSDATGYTSNGGDGAYIRETMNIGLEASDDLEIGCLDLGGEAEGEIPLNMLDMTEMHSSTLPTQSSTHGYMEESHTATLPLPGEQNYCIFKDKPAGLKSSESGHAVCEVPLSTLEITNTGADGYVQENIPQLPPSLSTGTSHDPHYIGFHTEYNTTTTPYSVAPPLASTMQQPFLDYVQDSNTERISMNSPALQQSQENTSGGNKSKTNHQVNCTSGDYVSDVTRYTSNGADGAYIRDPMNIGLETSYDLEIGCLDFEGEAEGEIPLNMLNMTGMHSSTLTAQSSRQGYMEESDASTLPLPGEQNHCIFKDKPVGLKPIENDREVLLTMPQFTNTGADRYVQQQKDETPSLSTGTSSDQIYTGDSNSSSSTYSTATATTNYIPEIPPSFSSSNAGGYIQSATSFPSVKTSLSADSGIEEFLVENLHMSDVSEAEDRIASTVVNTTMQNEVHNQKSSQIIPPTLPPDEHFSRFHNSPTSHTNTSVFEHKVAREMSLSSGYITQSSTDGSVFNPTSWNPDTDLESVVELESHKCQDYSAIGTEKSWVLQDGSYIWETDQNIPCQSNPTGYYPESVTSPLPSKEHTPESQTSTNSYRKPALDFGHPSLPAVCPPRDGYISTQSTPKSENVGPSSTNGAYILPSLLAGQYAGKVEHQPKPITNSQDLLPVSGKLPLKQGRMSGPNIQELEQGSSSSANSHQSAVQHQAADSESPSTECKPFVPSLLIHLQPTAIDQPLKLPSTDSLSVSANSPHMSRLNSEYTPEVDLCSISNASSCPPASDYIPGCDQISVSNTFQPASEYQNTTMRTHPDSPNMDSCYFVPSSLASLHHEHQPKSSAESLPVPRKLTQLSRSNSRELDQSSFSNANSCPLAARPQTNSSTLDLDPRRMESRCLPPSLLPHLHTGNAELQTDTSAHAAPLSVNCNGDHPSSLSAGISDGYIGEHSLENRLHHSQNSVHNSPLNALGHAIANTDYVDIKSWPLPTFAC